jgi:hemerythrin-like domain-containing protein
MADRPSMADRRSTTMSSGDAIDILRQDHEKLKDLLSQLTETTNRAAKTRTELLAKIKKEILVHSQLEEEIFYPAFKRTDGSEHKKMFFEAVEEHRAVSALVLPDLEQTDVTSDAFSGRAKVLKELIEHHAEEEEKEMFPKARKAFSSAQLKELGEQMQQLKAVLEKEL